MALICMPIVYGVMQRSADIAGYTHCKGFPTRSKCLVFAIFLGTATYFTHSPSRVCTALSRLRYAVEYIYTRYMLCARSRVLSTLPFPAERQRVEKAKRLLYKKKKTEAPLASNRVVRRTLAQQ